MESTTSILLTEEDAVTRAFLADNLAADGYEVLLADSKEAALETLGTCEPSIVICDVNGDTLALLDAVRRADGVASHVDPDVPLIVLTCRADELARVRYFERGCDDVVEKPFCYAELRARIAALLRRSHARRTARTLRVGPLRIDPRTREVHVGDRPIALSQCEFALLAHLATDPTRVYTKQELLRDVWGFRAQGRTRTLDSHACRLRNKLRAAGERGLLHNVWGVGYRLSETAPTPAA